MKRIKPSPPAIDTFYEKAGKLVADALEKQDMQPIQIGSGGEFPYSYETPDVNFYLKTWEFLNRNLEEVKGADRLAFGEPLTNQYLKYYNLLGYQLSAEDNEKLNAAKEKAQEVSSELVKEYERLYGKITPEMMTKAEVANKQDYILDYKVNSWAKNGRFVLSSETLDNLGDFLPKMPSSARVLLPLIGKALQPFLAVAGLVNRIYQSDSEIGNVKKNAEHPNEANNGVITEDDQKRTAYHAGIDVEPGPKQIDSRLKGDNKVSVHLSFSKFEEKEADLQIEGQAGGRVNLFSVLTISAESGTSYSLHELNTSFEECSVTLTYGGPTAVYIKPRPYQMDNDTGWFYLAPIKDAIENGPDPTKSGFVMTPYPSDGGIKVLEYLVISRFPSFRISYSRGSTTETLEKLHSESSVSVSLFGIPLGSAGYEYKSTSLDKRSEDEGFDIVFETPMDVTGNILDRRAHVIGGGITSLTP
ncbi:hypothetical protein ACW14Y_07435 [Kitasatospora sp. cg17-2]